MDNTASKQTRAAANPINLQELKANSTGFKIAGTSLSYAGASVSTADLNGDGFSDIITAAAGDPYGIKKGAVYVTFGKASGFADTVVTATNFAFTAASGINVGKSVSSAGDINGDGIADLVVGATGDIFGDSDGEAYVIFGNRKLTNINVAANATIPASQGFRIFGGGTKTLAYSINGTGDVNGDGFDDMVIGAPGNYTKLVPGVAYVVFGSAQAKTVDLAKLDGKNGFKFASVAAGNAFGGAVSNVGDMNGDGYDEILVGSIFADVGSTNSGSSYVLFGKKDGFANVTTAQLNGNNGFEIPGVVENGFNGFAVAGGGDINGDGLSDLLVTSVYNSSVYVVFGATKPFAKTLNLAGLQGSNGFILSGDATSRFGISANMAGDVNGDGYDDLLIGETGAEGEKGGAYVVFGKAKGFSMLNTADIKGELGFKINGVSVGDRAGIAVNAAGDVNGDGFDDLIIGATLTDKNVGTSYVVFGKDFSKAIDFLGGTGRDALTGTSAAENFVGGGGNDILNGLGGADSFNAGSGNDTIQMANLRFRAVDGGSGSDTFALTGKNLNFDLVAKHGLIHDIETINLTGTGNNNLILSANEVLNLSSTTNTLRILGNTGDEVLGISSKSGWVQSADQGGFQHFQNGNAIVLVGVSVDANFV